MQRLTLNGIAWRPFRSAWTWHRALTAPQLERLITALEVLELIHDPTGQRAQALAANDADAAEPATAATPSRRRSTTTRNATRNWPSLVAPLFHLLSILQTPTNAGTAPLAQGVAWQGATISRLNVGVRASGGLGWGSLQPWRPTTHISWCCPASRCS